MSIDVEQLFSCGCLVLPHTCSRLSSNSTRALLCLSSWSLLGLVKAEDIEKVSKLLDVPQGAMDDLEQGWDAIDNE